MGTTTLLSLDQRLLELIGDWIQHPVTTALAASTSVVSTHLQNYRSAVDKFNRYWIYIEDENNAGVSRKVSNDDGTSTLTVLGGNFTSDGADLATFRLSHSSWADRKRAINDALNEVYPNLYNPIENKNLIAGNLLPDGHFEEWSSATAMTFYSTSNADLARTSTAAYIRGGTYSSKVTTSAANGYMYISSNSHPKLLNCMDNDIDFKCWVYPENANDAFLVIYTIKADGTTQTLTSTTACPAGKWTLLELEDQSINDDIVEIQFRFKVATNGAYAYFDNARVTGVTNFDYVLPSAFDNGTVSQVFVQVGGYSEDVCDDLYPTSWRPIYDNPQWSDGTYNYLRIPRDYSKRQIKLIGEAPFAELSAATDTINLDGPKLDLLMEYAAYRLYQTMSSGASAEDKSRYKDQSYEHLLNYTRLAEKMAMGHEAITMNLPSLR